MISEEGSSTPSPQQPYTDTEEDYDHHRPLSPPTPAESLFLPTNLIENNSRISASALASSIHSVHSSRSVVTSLRSIATQDFASACGDLSEHTGDREEDVDLYDVQITSNHNNNSTTSLFGKDILFFSRPTIEEEEDFEESSNNSSISGKMGKSKTKPTIVDKSGSAVPSQTLASGDMNTPTADDEAHFDVGTNVYEAAKGVWGWGKSIPLAGKFLGLYEAVGAKVITTAVHKDLSTVDAELKHHVSGIDKDIIDPAIAAILHIIFPAVEKGEEVFRPIIEALLGPFFPQICSEAAINEPERTSTPRLEVN